MAEGAAVAFVVMGVYIPVRLTLQRGEVRVVVEWKRALTAVVVAGGVSLVAPASGTALPPGYGYEKVSPGAVAKGDSDVQIQYGAVRSSADGTRVTYAMLAAGETDEGASWPTQTLATMTREGWSIRSLTPPIDPDLGAPVLDNRLGYQMFSDDLSVGALIQGDPALVPGAATGDGTRNVYLRDTGVPEQRYELVTPSPRGALTLADSGGQSLFTYAPVVVDGTAGLRRIVFETSFIALAPDAVEGYNVPNVYEWDNGIVRLVSVLEDGRPAPNGAVAGAGAWGGLAPSYGAQWPGGRVMSSDGRRIFFTVPEGLNSPMEGDVYVRIDGETTRLVSRSQRSIPDPDGSMPASFVSASDDGRYAFFSSQEKLTDDSTATIASPQKRDLYRYDAVTGTLIDLTSGIDSLASFNYVVGTGRDGGTVYFLTNDRRLWVWTDGSARLVTDVGVSDIGFVARHSESAIIQSQRQAAMSDDGRWLVVSAKARLADRDPNGTAQFYLYDRDTDRFVRCVSCPSGRAPVSDAWTNNRVVFTDMPIMRDYPPRAFNARGDRFTFMTRDRLVDDDKNAAVDVYQYDLGTGDVTLISPGTGKENAYFSDASADGETIFFATRDRILRQDDDGLIDLYVARPGARNENPDEPLPPCAGDACQGPLSTSPADLPSGTATFSGPDDEEQPSRARVFAVKSITRAAAARFATTGRLRLSVRVSDAGTVNAVASGKLHKRTRVVARASKLAFEGGNVDLTLNLSKAARRHLKRHRPLRVSINVSFADGGGTQRASLLLKRPAPKAKRDAR